MVKFLKLILALVVIAFSFALGVKFSDSFKGINKNENMMHNKIVESNNITTTEDNAIPEIENNDQMMENISSEQSNNEIDQTMDGITDTTSQENIQEPVQINDGMINNEEIPAATEVTTTEQTQEPVTNNTVTITDVDNTQPVKTVQPTTNTTVNK